MKDRDPTQKKIPLVELFGPTVQGEGAVIGQQTYFLRFGLCDYKCTMCDSMHAVDPKQVSTNAERLTQDEIYIKLVQFYKPGSTSWITYSGGNPCIHDLTQLTGLLVGGRFKIAVETQGTFCPEWLQECHVITCSPKGPGMGEIFEPDKFDAFCVNMADHPGFNIKLVIFDERDLEFARMILERTRGQIPIFLSQGNPSPPGGELDIAIEQGLAVPSDHVELLRANYLRLFEDIQCDPLLSQLKFLPQWHVWLYGNRQGV